MVSLPNGLLRYRSPPSVAPQQHLHLHYRDSAALVLESLSRRIPQIPFRGGGGDGTPGRSDAVLQEALSTAALLETSS